MESDVLARLLSSGKGIGFNHLPWATGAAQARIDLVQIGRQLQVVLKLANGFANDCESI